MYAIGTTCRGLMMAAAFISVGAFAAACADDPLGPHSVGFRTSPGSLELLVGEIGVIRVDAPAGEGVEWTTSDARVVQVDAGMVIAVGEGSALIHATAIGDPMSSATTFVVVYGEECEGDDERRTRLDVATDSCVGGGHANLP